MLNHRLERRRQVRIPVRLCLYDNYQVSGLLLDISRDGMFIATPARPRGNGHLLIQVPAVHAGGRRPICFPAQVVHRAKGGFGVMLSALDAEAQALLELWLSQAPEADSPTGRRDIKEAGTLSEGRTLG